ncbi:MAG: polyprenol phosphomannose-dependent alpha 1,6 mannosyltransferase MptB, partial [Actinomycetota bacterium]|nr:polyprenol phosphomannose-dependent alpha 1,6 mannosyltransferase MptB [Actinomycetota bacterium]
MNELGSVAKRAFDLARSGVRARPSISLAVAGFAAAALTVVMGGRVGPPASVIPLTTWLGLMPRNSRGSGFVPAALMIVGILALLALWLIALRTHRSERVSEPTVWLIGAAWGTPFIIGPPLLSNDVFTYAAQGLLLRKGLDPYSVGPSALGNVRAVAAVDPSWRSVPSPYGPLATTLQHLAVSISGGSALGAALVLRALGVVCIVAIGVLATELVGPRGRSSALTITVLNPLLLLHIVSAAHLDGVMCVLLLGAIVAANQRRWSLGIVLAVAAGAVKA